MNVDRQVLFLLTVVLFGILFSLGPFGLSVGFFVTLSIIAAFLLGILGVYVFGGNMRLHTNLPFIAYVLALASAFIFMSDGFRSGSSTGFPFPWITVQPIGKRISLDVLVLALNALVFYVLLRLGRGMYRNVKQSPGQKRQAET
ncbi:hypothetical protein ACFO4L_06660 [Bacillus daqingensis]|uniref:Uncharacterized protein n=1 Tax=Bacillus daqingensis TaxID=872396 RepID=A0ABV9NSF1_9BACI